MLSHRLIQPSLNLLIILVLTLAQVNALPWLLAGFLSHTCLKYLCFVKCFLLMLVLLYISFLLRTIIHSIPYSSLSIFESLMLPFLSLLRFLSLFLSGANRKCLFLHKFSGPSPLLCSLVVGCRLLKVLKQFEDFLPLVLFSCSHRLLRF